MSTSRWIALGLALTACILAMLMRLFPLEWNLVPIGALALFAGARLRSWWGFALPLGAMVLTDYLLSSRPGNMFPHAEMPYSYGCFFVSFLLGRWAGQTENVWRLCGLSVLGSVLFFLGTNFGAWLNTAVFEVTVVLDPQFAYPPTLSGLWNCYVLGLPFYRGTFFGDLIFSAALFGSYAWLTRSVFVPERLAMQTSE